MALSGPDLNVGVYPSDIAISGPTPVGIRARAAIVSRLVTAPALLTTSKEAQEVEDRLRRLARPAGAAGVTPQAGRRAEFEAIDSTLVDLAVPTDQWDILYRIRLQIERDLLIGAEPGTVFPGHESNPREIKASRGSAPHATAAHRKRERAEQADQVSKGSLG
jgi:hypothetical protein